MFPHLLRVHNLKCELQVITLPLGGERRISAHAQGAFVTTAECEAKALEVATKRGLPRVRTIDGNQLVDLLSARWDHFNLPAVVRPRLGLERGLIPE